MCFTIKNEAATSRKNPWLSFKKGRSEKEGSDKARDYGEDVDNPESDLVRSPTVATKLKEASGAFFQKRDARKQKARIEPETMVKTWTIRSLTLSPTVATKVLQSILILGHSE